MQASICMYECKSVYLNLVVMENVVHIAAERAEVVPSFSFDKVL